MSEGMFMELVAKPIPKVMASSVPRNSATKSSNSRWMSIVPSSLLVLATPQPCRRVASNAALAQGPSFSAKPK